MPPTVTTTTTEVDIDVGKVYVAPIGTAEPSGPTAALDTAWREVGYTEDGSKMRTEITVADVEVAEEVDPIVTKTTKRVTKVSFTMAQMSRRNLALALNQGADAANGGTTLEPVDLDDEVRVMVLWESSQTGADQRRWLFRQCYNVGTFEVANAKSPQKRLMGVEFQAEKPAAAASFAVFPSNSGEV